METFHDRQGRFKQIQILLPDFLIAVGKMFSRHRNAIARYLREIKHLIPFGKLNPASRFVVAQCATQKHHRAEIAHLLKRYFPLEEFLICPFMHFIPRHARKIHRLAAFRARRVFHRLRRGGLGGCGGNFPRPINRAQRGGV